jgi:hypothetical protein
MRAERRIRQAETRLFARSGLRPEESFVDISSAKVRLRVLSVGTGPAVVMLHGVSLAAAVWHPCSPISPGTGRTSSSCRVTACPGRPPTGRARCAITPWA